MKQLSKLEMLTKIEQEHKALMKTIASLDEADLLKAGVLCDPAPGQSCKDILAHLSAWEVRMLAQVRATLKAAAMADFPPTQQFNAQVFAANRERSLPDVIANFAQSFLETTAFVEQLSEIEIATDGVWQLIGYNTYSHYKWANKVIRHWRRTQKA